MPSLRFECISKAVSQKDLITIQSHTQYETMDTAKQLPNHISVDCCKKSNKDSAPNTTPVQLQITTIDMATESMQ